MLNLHPAAIARFNERARSIADRVAKEIVEKAAEIKSESAGTSGAKKARRSWPDQYVAAEFDESNIIGVPKIGKVDRLGRRVGYSFQHDGVKCWIEDESYTEVVRLAEAVHRCGSTSELLSQDTIQDCICSWIENRFANSSMSDFVERLETKADEVVKEIEMRAPIAELFIENGFRFGNLWMGRTTREEIDGWESEALGRVVEHRGKLEEYFKKKIRRMQGHGYASLKIRAEPARAREILLYEAERAVSILRVFSVAALHPQAVSGCVLWGNAQRDNSFLLIVEEDRLASSNEAIKGAPLVPVTFSDYELKEKRKLGLDVFSRLLCVKTLSEFEQQVLDATLLYSRCTLAKTVTDKLTYIFAALESIFIKNNIESIQSNLAERMAFALERSPDDRKVLIRNVKETYSLRSRFLHHGEKIDDLQQVERFMVYAWRTMFWLIGAVGHFDKIDDMMNELERRKLS